MKEMLIKILVPLFLSMLSPDLIRKFFSDLGDKIAEKVSTSETKIDDKVLELVLKPVEGWKELGDFILDFAENYVLGTKSTIDDAIVLPICNLIRDALSIPDND